MLIDQLRHNLGGCTVYVRKRPAIDWSAIQDERSQGVSAATLAKRLGVSERTVRNHTSRPMGK